MLDIVHKFIKLAPPAEQVLEVGAYNVNGTARDALSHAKWFGVDLRNGPCVDMVCDAADGLPFSDGEFDCAVCVETLEHCERWFEVLSEVWRCLAVEGRCIVTTPSPGFPRHEHPSDYWRFTAADWLQVFAGQWVVALLQYPITSGIIVCKVSDSPLARLTSMKKAPQ